MPKLSEKDFAALVKSMPGASESQILAAAKKAESLTAGPGLWERLNTPTVDVPEFEHSPDEGVLARWGKNAGNFVSDVAEGMTSPLGLATAAVGGAGALAGRAGLLGISQGARMLEAGLQAPYAIEGVKNIAEGAINQDPGEAVAGAVEAGLAAVGMRGSLAHSFPPAKVRSAYLESAGLPDNPLPRAEKWDPQFAGKVADAFDAMPHAPQDPAVAATYNAMGKEVSDQFSFLRDRAGLKMEPWTQPGQPYANSAEMMADVQRNNHLWFFPSEGGFGSGDSLDVNPMLQPGVSGMPVNDEFRAVHDYFGHTVSGNQFGPLGEENAYRDHVAMFTPESVPAVTSETRGQNSWVNAGAHLRRADGSLPVKGDPDFIPVTERPFADQKAGILPREFRALSIAAPAVGMGIPDDPDTEADDYARLLLYGAGAAGAVGYFPKRLKLELDTAAKELRASGAKKTEVLTALRQKIKDIYPGNPKMGTKMADLYEARELPVHEGINFDQRRPLKQLLKKGKDGPELTDFSKQRILSAYKMGMDKTEGWGDPSYLGDMTAGSPELAVKLARFLGATSPGTKTHWNALQGLEFFIRTGLQGEDPKQVVNSMKSMGVINASSKLPNLKRAAQGGRIFQDKVEALAGAEVGALDDIPIDLWFLRAMGAQSERTPSGPAYDAVRQAVRKLAAENGEELFPFMAKVWTGMQHIAGSPTPSFKTAFEQMDLPTPVTDPEAQRWILDNMAELKRRIFKGGGQRDLFAAEAPAKREVSYDKDKFRTDARTLFQESQRAGDVLSSPKQGRLARAKKSA